MPHVADPLWVPVLAHYRPEDPPSLDGERVLAHLASLAPSVRQLLVAGTTGDGWGMSPQVFADWMALLADPRLADLSLKVMIGILEPTTEAVIEKARQVEAMIAERPLAVGFAGLTVCPPVDENASQAQIAAHFSAVIAATGSPIAVYQLPQVTGCEIAPETFAGLFADGDRIAFFKDTSGTDRVVSSGVPTGAVVRLRGAEGDYARHRAPEGGYDGWLLSSANGFAPQLREIADLLNAGDAAAADRESMRLTTAVEALFAIASASELDNPFSLANRIVDHLNFAGPDWRSLPGPLTRHGNRAPPEILAEAEAVLEEHGLMRTAGYRRA